MLKIILASKSPRRRQILQEFGYKFEVVPVQTSEIFEENLSIDQALLSISKAKVQACLVHLGHRLADKTLVIGADTIVELEGLVLGKPNSQSQARSFLQDLSGKGHLVKTSVVLYNKEIDQWFHFVETSQVRMKKLSATVIDSYIESGEPMDKAGAYAIQGKGGELVDSFEGSWHNIVGFPIERFEKEVLKKGWVLDVDRGKSK